MISRPFFLVIFLLAINLKVFGQDWGTPVVVDFPRWNQASLDNQNFLFISDLEGNIYQYDARGRVINNFSPPRQGRLTQLEAAWTVNIFSFSADLQEYRFFDRFINPIAENRIPMQHIGLAKAATLGNNNILWVFDESDLSLKQIDFQRNRMVQEQPLNLVLGNSQLEVSDIREYQNLLFLNVNREGVYVFDNQANLIKRMNVFPEQSLSFWKDGILEVFGDQICHTSFNSGNKKCYDLPEDFEAKGILMNRNLVLLFDDKQFRIYAKKESPLEKF